MDTFEQMQVIAHIGPQTIDGVHMNFAVPVSVIIARPSEGGVTDRRMRAAHMMVTGPFIRMAVSHLHRKAVRVLLQHRLRGVMNHPQAHVPTIGGRSLS